jgi:hypothetical protein
MTRALILCLFLTACDTRAMTCRSSAGPEPMAGADLLGIGGMLAAHQNPERRDWDERVRICMKEARR